MSLQAECVHVCLYMCLCGSQILSRLTTSIFQRHGIKRSKCSCCSWTALPGAVSWSSLQTLRDREGWKRRGEDRWMESESGWRVFVAVKSVPQKCCCVLSHSGWEVKALGLHWGLPTQLRILSLMLLTAFHWLLSVLCTMPIKLTQI